MDIKSGEGHTNGIAWFPKLDMPYTRVVANVVGTAFKASVQSTEQLGQNHD